MIKELKFHVDNRDYGLNVSIYAAKSIPGTTDVDVVNPIETTRQSHDSAMLSEPMMRMSLEEAQGLANALWEAGVRPAQYVSSDEVGAMKTNLDDLRTIAFKLLKIESK